MKEGWKGRAPFEKSRRRLNAIVFGELRWRQRQPIPLTTIRQDYNWDYRLLTLNACIVLPDKSQGPFDNFIEMLALAAVLSSVLDAAVKKAFATHCCSVVIVMEERGGLAFRQIPFPLCSLPLSPYKIPNSKSSCKHRTFEFFSLYGQPTHIIHAVCSCTHTVVSKVRLQRKHYFSF